MAEKRATYKIRELEGVGEVSMAAEVVTVIAALAATEVEGVASLGGNITHDAVDKANSKSLNKSVKLNVEDGSVKVDLIINMEYGKNILETSKKVQERVTSSIENMTDLKVLDVNVKIASVDMENEKGK